MTSYTFLVVFDFEVTAVGRACAPHVLNSMLVLTAYHRLSLLKMFCLQVHYYYDFSDYILPPNVGVNRPLKIMLDQTIYFISKCAMYITLVRTGGEGRQTRASSAGLLGRVARHANSLAALTPSQKV